MKKIFVLIASSFAISFSAYGQQITANMFDVFKGHPKEIKYEDFNTSQVLYTVEFDYDGKVQAMSQNGSAIKFIWNEDNSEIECHLLNGSDEVVNKSFIYIDEMSDSLISYTCEDTQYKYHFNENHTVQKITGSGQIQSATSTYYYKDENRFFPYKIVNVAGTNSQVILNYLRQKDEYGNALEYSQSSNGMTVLIKRSILYYK